MHLHTGFRLLNEFKYLLKSSIDNVQGKLQSYNQ